MYPQRFLPQFSLKLHWMTGHDLPEALSGCEVHRNGTYQPSYIGIGISAFFYLLFIAIMNCGRNMPIL